MYQAKQGLNKKRGPVSPGLKEGLDTVFGGFDMARLGHSRSLSKDERLSRELLIDKLFKEGRSISQNGFTLVYLKTCLPAFYPAQAAFSVPKRCFKHATDRNRIKRHLREAYRLNKIPLYQRLTDLKSQLALMLIYKGKEIPDHVYLHKNILELLSKLIERLK